MDFRTARSRLWPLILLLCSSPATSLLINFDLKAPKTFWVDNSCFQKGFTPVTAGESLAIAGHGSRRLLNLNDEYQAYVFELIFQNAPDFSLMDNAYTEAWNVVGERLPKLTLEMQLRRTESPPRSRRLDCCDEIRNQQGRGRCPYLLWWVRVLTSVPFTLSIWVRTKYKNLRKRGASLYLLRFLSCRCVSVEETYQIWGHLTDLDCSNR